MKILFTILFFPLSLFAVVGSGNNLPQRCVSGDTYEFVFPNAPVPYVSLPPLNYTCSPDNHWTLVSTGSAGLGDPGSNGIVKRTALNTATAAGSADVIALWTGTCSSTTYMRGDGSCQTPSGSGDASTNTSSSVDSEVAIFSGTAGKTFKRSALTGIIKQLSGVQSVATPGTDYVVPGGNVATATALAANPADCGGGTFATAIAANGDLTCGTPAGGGNVSNSGTPTSGQIPVWQSSTTQSGVTNLSLPGDVYAKGRPHVDVKHSAYGALGDGSTDDITAITAAVAAAANLGTIGGNPQSALLYLPCGVYVISTPIILPRGTNTLSNGVVDVKGESKSCVTITGTAGFPANRDLIEWSQSSSVRTLSQTISDITFVEPGVDGVGSIHYQYTATNTPVTTANATNERMERLTLRNLEFRGNNQYQPHHIYLEGDCFNCNIENVYWDDVRASGGAYAGVNNVYDTIGLQIDTCYTSGVPSNETCGFLDSRIMNIGHIGNRGGYTQAFQGRLNRGIIESAFCNGVKASHCFEITNSYQYVMTNISTEGLGGQPEILCTNSVQGKWYNIGIGAPNNSGSGIGNGMEFNGCSQNQLWSTSANSAAQNAWAVQQVISSFTGLSGGTGCSVAPTWVSSGGSATQNASGRTTISGGVVQTMIIDIGGNFQGTPTIVFTGTGCSGQSVTPVLTGAGTLYQIKLDSNSHQNVFWDLHQDGIADVSFSDTTTNFAQSCDQSSSACATYFTIGSLPGVSLPASALTSSTVATARLGSGTANSSSYLRGDQTWQAITGISGLTTGVIPKAGSATTIANSLLDDGVTTANVLTYTGSGGIATAPSGGAAGFFGMTAGSARSVVTSTVGEYAPTSVTGYNFVKPAAAGNGILTNTNASNIVTQAFLPGTTTTVLHGNASGPPTYAGVALADLTATGTPTSTVYLRGDYSWAALPQPTGSYVLMPFVINTTTGSVATNGTRCTNSVNNQATITATHIAFEITTLQASTHAGVTIYSADGSTKIADSGAQDSSTASVKTATVSSFTLVFGTEYRTCMTADGGTPPTFRVANASNMLLNNVTTAAMGTAANAGSAGVTPSTTGAITGSATANVAMVLVY